MILRMVRALGNDRCIILKRLEIVYQVLKRGEEKTTTMIRAVVWMARFPKAPSQVDCRILIS